MLILDKRFDESVQMPVSVKTHPIVWSAKPVSYFEMKLGSKDFK